MTKAAVAVSALAVVGTLGAASGVGAAQAKPVGDKAPASKEDCKKDGFRQFGFKNQGQCVSFAVHADKDNGYGHDKDHGYGNDKDQGKNGGDKNDDQNGS